MKSLAYWRRTIQREVDYVDTKPYSHNIISVALSAIARDFSKAKANKAIKDFGLEELGWRPAKDL